MLNRNVKARDRAVLSAVVLAAGMCIAPVGAHAQGFFEQLFGVGHSAPAQAPAPTYDYGQPQIGPGLDPEPYVLHRRKKADLDTKPVLQKTTDIMHDKTLHYGDGVMMKTGVHVYAGPGMSRHTADQFVKLDDARLSKSARSELVAMDMTRRDPLAYAPLREGRSASTDTANVLSDARPVSVGYRITDARGKSVRYVGP